MIPAHDRVRLTERERGEFDRLVRDHAAPAAGPSPATLLTVGLLAMVVGSVVALPVMVVGVGLALSGLGRAMVAGSRA